jgi:glycosyltransferase involved in cell wall biosynthesis
VGRTGNYTISVVIVVHDQAEALEHNLPQFLTVASASQGEVIVVDDSSTDNTPDVLKLFKEGNPQLYTTFLPKSVPNKSRLQLALNIGAKAALSSRIVFADITRPPLVNEWLTGLAEGTVTVVYCRLKHGTPQVLHQLFDDIEEASNVVLKAERRGGGGHRGRWFRMRRGMYDAIAVNKEQIVDAIKLFDQRLTAGRKMKLGVGVFFKNLFS